MISIIIPTLNEEKILAVTLKKLRHDITSFVPTSAHKDARFEIIISDGKSTDKTQEIAHMYADKVAVHSLPTRQTIAEGRNEGAQVAQGDILMFMDADCQLKDPNLFFNTVISSFQDNKLAALAGWLKVLPENATFADRLISYIVSFVYMVLNNYFLIGSASGELQIMRTSLFKQLGGYNQKLVTGEDVDMFNRLAKLGKTRLDSTLLVYHTGRRAHKIGWPKLLFQWFMSTLWMAFTGKSLSKEWTVIR